MQQQQQQPQPVVDTQEFLQTGRTGRRNALPDILSEQHAHTATADLAAKMQELSTGTDTAAQQPQPHTPSHCPGPSNTTTSSTSN